MTGLRNAPIFWGETWRLALQALSANKIRAMLTTLGVIIGSACIVLVVTVGLAGRRYIIRQIEGVGSNLVFAQIIHSGAARPLTLADEITPADMQAVKESIAGVVEVAGTSDMTMSISVDGRERPIILVGVTDGYQKIRNLIILQGRYRQSDVLGLARAGQTGSARRPRLSCRSQRRAAAACIPRSDEQAQNGPEKSQAKSGGRGFRWSAHCPLACMSRARAVMRAHKMFALRYE